MTNPANEIDLYGIWGDRSLTISQFPCVANLTFFCDGKAHSLHIISPSSCAELTVFLNGECCHISVVDRNVEESNYLEFGRFRIELGGEDGPIGTLQADEVTLAVEP